MLVRLVAWGIAPVAVYLSIAVLGAFVPNITRDDVGPRLADNEIILAAGIIHYDILLPLNEDTRSAFSFLDQSRIPLDDGDWLAVGWGSEAFYTSAGQYSDVSWRALFTAMTWDSSAIRFEIYKSLPQHPSLHRITVSDAQLDALRDSIRDDLVADPEPLAAEGLSETDVFYAAAGAFNLVRTCNVWVGSKLSDAGLSFGIWTPTPYAVRWSMWWNGLT